MKNFRFDALTLILINAIMPVMCAIFPSQKMVALTYIMASLILVVSGNIRRIFKVICVVAVFCPFQALETY